MSGEAAILDRISKARGNSEPEPAPTEEPVAVDVSIDEAPEEVVEEVEAINSADAETDTEAEELEVVSDEIVTADDDEEDLYVDYKGREINLKNIEEWEQGHLRQADYTRKTQELADQRKAFEAEKEGNGEQQAKLNAHIATLQAIIDQESLSDEQIAELREYEPEEYIKYQEKIKARNDAISGAKETQPVSNVDIEGERQKLWAANPKWLEDGKQTQAFKDDMSRLETYAKERGYSDQEIAGVQEAHHWQTLLDAAKYRDMSQKNAIIEKKVRKAPVTTKPRAANQTNIQTKIKKAQAQLKKTGRDEDAVALRRLKRQLQE